MFGGQRTGELKGWVGVKQPSPRVLVVEDYNAVRWPLEVALRNEGCVVEACSDGRAPEPVVSEFRPDLVVLLDVRLPVGPDGYSMARTLRRMGDLPILFLTSADAEHERLAGFEAGGTTTRPSPSPWRSSWPG